LKLRGERRQLALELGKLIIVIRLVGTVLGRILIQRFELGHPVKDGPGHAEGAVLRLQKRGGVAHVILEVSVPIGGGRQFHGNCEAARVIGRADDFRTGRQLG
jgi:hypothetical protein